MSKNINSALVDKYNSLNTKINNKIIKNIIKRVLQLQNNYQAINSLRE